MKKPLHLTPREREILELFARGTTYAEMAELLGTRPGTVKNQLKGIRDKMQASTTAEALVRARKIGLMRSAAQCCIVHDR